MDMIINKLINGAFAGAIKNCPVIAPFLYFKVL